MSEGRSILVCDDEPELAEELGEFLSASGWDTHVCVSGREAQRLLAGGLAPTCLLTDLRMADFDGADLISAARGLAPAARPRVIAVMTGHVVDRVGAADVGADVLYIKPIDVDALLRDLTRLSAAKVEEGS
jgi:DNA-binding response OmpR family regulator